MILKSQIGSAREKKRGTYPKEEWRKGKKMRYTSKGRIALVFLVCAYARTPLHMDGGLDHFFLNSILLDVAKHGFSII